MVEKLTVAEIRTQILNEMKKGAMELERRRRKCEQCNNPMLKGIHTCEKAKPKQLDPEVGDALSDMMFGKTPDEDLLRQLHDCCNPNCLVINEVIKRFKKLKEASQDYSEI